MIDHDAFICDRQQRWDALEDTLKSGLTDPTEIQELSRLYRAVAADLASAQSHDLPDHVLRYLDGLASRAHNALYGTRELQLIHPLRLILSEFPIELRRQWGFFLIANVLFYGPFFVGLLSCWADPTVAAHVLPQAQLDGMAEMYSDATTRPGTQDAEMAGFYVFNNVGIAFRCFSTGVFGGLGSLYFLVFNGAILGTTFGYLFAVGRGFHLLTFTAGHTAWELTGIVVAGTAGLRLGWSILVTEGFSRVESVRRAGMVVFRLMAGCAVMLFMAALIEGFWSASPIPPPAKFLFGVTQVVVVALWLIFGGRGASR